MPNPEPPRWVTRRLALAMNAGETLEDVAILRSAVHRRIALVRTSARLLLVEGGFLTRGRVHVLPQPALPPFCSKCGAPQAPDAAPSPPGFQFKGYYLFKREVALPGGRWEVRYVFAKEKPDSAVPCFVPPGFEVAEDPDSGVPYLRRIN